MASGELERNAAKAEEIVEYLIAKLATLEKNYGQKGRCSIEAEMNAITKKNNNLKIEIEKLKFDMEYLKLQTGEKLIPLPIVTQSTQEKLPTQPALEIVKTQTSPEIAVEKAEKNVAKKETSSKKNNVKSAGKEEEKEINVSRLDMRIGKIISVEKHPDADSLYVEQVDLGEDKPRTIVSGLVKFIDIKDMQDRIAVFMCNLKPAKMRGISSAGMIMCASTPENVQPITPPADAKIGDRISCPDFKGEPDKQLNPKRKIWEQVQPDLRVNSEGVATYKGSPLTIEGKGVCKSISVRNCPIK